MRTPLLSRLLLSLVLCAVAPSVLGQTPPASPASVAAYVEQLKSPDQKQRIQAASAIASLGPQAKDAVPDLVAMLSAPATVEQMAAMMALAKIGPDAKPALPALRQIAASGNDNAKKVAELTIESIEPPFSTILMRYLTSPYVVAGLISVGAGALALVALGLRRGNKLPEPVWKEEQAKAQQARAQKAKEKEAAAAKPAEATAAAPAKPAPVAPPAPKAAAPAAKPLPAAPPWPTPTPSAPKPAASKPAAAAPAPVDRVPKHRARVSRPLLGLGNYVQEQEGPESTKRDLTRAQDELKKIVDTQKEISALLEKDEVARDPARLRNLRKEIDEYAIEHYRAEVRVKALEIKLIEALAGDGKTSDAELRERTGTTLKQKWDELRTLCETPAKIVYKSGQWVTTATGPTVAISDLRARLRDFDVVVPDRSVERSTEPSAEPSAESSAEQSTEPRAEPNADSSVEPGSEPNTGEPASA